jgi:hypothetical protein
MEFVGGSILPTKELTTMAGMMRVPRSRGAFSGVLLILLGIWGGLVPFIGPYIHYAYTPNQAWHWTSGRLWMEVLPGVATLLGGVVVVLSRMRPLALLGAWLAVLAGAWFAVGSTLAPLWNPAISAVGTPVGSPTARAFEQVGFFTGLGVLIVLVAAFVLGRLAVISAKDMRAAGARREPKTVPAPADSDSSPIDTGTGESGKRSWRLVGRSGSGKVSTGL